MGEVCKLKLAQTPPLPVDADVVAELERLLTDAKAGKFNGLAYATITVTGAGAYTDAGTGFYGQGIVQSTHTAVGIVDGLKFRMLNELFSWPHDDG